MKLVDFSSKHHILIKNLDGTYSPMDFPYFQAKYIGTGVWQVLSDGDYIYLVEGENEALAIDSGLGCGDLRAFLQSLTSKPVNNIANTHEHFDHTANNYQFDRAYMSEYTSTRASIPFPGVDFDGMEFPKCGAVTILKEGDRLELGNRILEVFRLPDHTEGSLAFVDRTGRNLFSGDELVSRFKILNGSVARFAAQMEKMNAYRADFDRICAGNMMFDACYIERYLENANYILSGHVGEPLDAMPHPDFSDFLDDGILRFDRQLPRRTKEQQMFSPDVSHLRVMVHANCKIIYDERNV